MVSGEWTVVGEEIKNRWNWKVLYRFREPIGDIVYAVPFVMSPLQGCNMKKK